MQVSVAAVPLLVRHGRRGVDTGRAGLRESGTLEAWSLVRRVGVAGHAPRTAAIPDRTVRCPRPAGGAHRPARGRGGTGFLRRGRRRGSRWLRCGCACGLGVPSSTALPSLGSGSAAATGCSRWRQTPRRSALTGSAEPARLRPGDTARLFAARPRAHRTLAGAANQQAASWPGALDSRGGSWSTQVASALKHRGWNRQPDGRWTLLGTSPHNGMR